MTVPVTERSIFIRPFNFLRVKHKYAFSHNFLVPFVLFLPILIASIVGTDGRSILLISTLNSELDLLKLILPFSITSLAVVSTFAGPESIDRKFKMSSEVTLLVAKSGVTEKIDVTPRHYMSLLFSYVSVACMVAILIFSIFEPLSRLLPQPIEYMAASAILFIFSQVLVLSFVAIYLLGDYLARQRLA